MKTKEGVIFATFLICMIGLSLISSYSYNPKTRLVPLLVGSVSLVLGVLVVLGELLPRFRQLFEVDLFTRDGMFSREKSISRWGEKTGLFIAVFWVILFAVLLFLIGFTIATPICVFVYVKFFGKQSWTLSTMVTVMVWIFIYGLFQILMDYQLFEGILFGGIV